MIVSSLCNASTRFSALQQANNHIPADNTHVCDEFRVCMETSALMRHSGEEAIDVRKMTEHKRSPCTVDQSSVIYLASKRHKSDLTISAKERKEKLSERIVALQQLVSPYGKSDTASVLTEAMDYIRFLHEQVKVLSAPYLLSTPTTKMQELKPYSLRSRGLCLVPVDSTIGVAQTNGADIWAPIKTCSPKFENNTSNFH